MGQSGTKRRKSPSDATATLRAQAVQYFRLGWSDAQISQLFKRSESTIHKWRSHPQVKAALRELEEHVAEETREQATDIAAKAWRTLEDLLSSDDDKVRLETAKTVLSRRGEPEQTRASVEASGPGGGPVQSEYRVTIDVARELAKEGE